MEFLERTGYTHSWGEEVHCLVVEKGWNGEFIEWDYWAGLSNITPNQAARLYWCIDPIKWTDNEYAQGTITDDLQEKILRLTQWLESRGANWCLNELANALGLDNLPYGMAEAVKKQRIDEASKHCFDIQSLEPLTDEEKQRFNNCAAWSWVDAIYILQGYKPVFQLNTEQVHSHFPNLVNYFTQSIQLGNIGKEIIEAGIKTFIDSPANWQAFWQSINNKPEPKAKGGGKGKFEHVETTEWKAKAREIGETWMQAQRNTGEDPGVIGIAKYVEGEFKRLDIRGRRDDYLDWQTIKRQALRGITRKPANGKDQKGRKKPGESPATKIITQQKTQ